MAGHSLIPIPQTLNHDGSKRVSSAYVEASEIRSSAAPHHRKGPVVIEPVAPQCSLHPEADSADNEKPTLATSGNMRGDRQQCQAAQAMKL